jgi:hypothetical protein
MVSDLEQIVFDPETRLESARLSGHTIRATPGTEGNAPSRVTKGDGRKLGDSNVLRSAHECLQSMIEGAAKNEHAGDWVKRRRWVMGGVE